MRSLLAAQQTFVDRLVHVMKAVQRESGNRKKKVTKGLGKLSLARIDNRNISFSLKILSTEIHNRCLPAL